MLFPLKQSQSKLGQTLVYGVCGHVVVCWGQHPVLADLLISK